MPKHAIWRGVRRGLGSSLRLFRGRKTQGDPEIQRLCEEWDKELWDDLHDDSEELIRRGLDEPQRRRA
jgi:hypothetical protein